MINVPKWIAPLLCLALAGCASHDRFSFVEYSRNPAKYDPKDSSRQWAPNDEQALQFSSNVVRLLRAKASGARITREVSNAAQVTFSGLAGASPVFGFSDRTLAVLGLGGALTPDFQGIFNAKGRAEAYSDAVRLIETAQSAYLAHNQQPTEDKLTQNGATVIQRTQASVHIVEKVLSGRVPTIIDLEQATEKMSAAGAKATNAGVAHNLVEADGTKPETRVPTKFEIDAAVDRKVAAMEQRRAENVGKQKAQPVERTEFQAKVGRLKRELKPIVGDDLQNLWTARYPATAFPGEEPARQKLFDDLTTFRDTPTQSDGTMNEATLGMLKKWQTDLGQ